MTETEMQTKIAEKIKELSDGIRAIARAVDYLDMVLLADRCERGLA